MKGVLVIRFNDDIDVTKFYKRTYWMLRIYSSFSSLGCCICAIIFLFLDINKFPMKFTIVWYLVISAIAIETLYLIITSLLLRFVFRDEINYKHRKNVTKIKYNRTSDNARKIRDIQDENESFDDESSNNDEMSTYSHHKMTSQEKISTILLFSIIVILITSMIVVAIFLK